MPEVACEAEEEDPESCSALVNMLSQTFEGQARENFTKMLKSEELKDPEMTIA